MLVASWITVSLISRFVPFAWVLFGNVPKRGLAKEQLSHAPSSPKFRAALLITSIILIGSAALAGYYLRSNDTVNTSTKQEFLKVAATEEVMSTYDVIVAGTEPEGVAAAISAARNGQSVLLVDGRNREILGGLMTIAGLNSLDLNFSPKKSPIPGKHVFLNKGIFQEWYDQIEGTSFDTISAANAFYRMVEAEPSIDLLMKVQSMEPLVVSGADGQVTVTGMRIVKQDGTTLEVASPAVIDATQDGDITALAGAPFTLGREDIGDPDAQMAVTLVFAMKGVTQAVWDSFDDAGLAGIDTMSAWGFTDAANYVSSNPERIKMRGLNIGRQNDETMLINAMHIFGVDPLDPASLAAALEDGRAEAPRIVDYLKNTFKEFKDLEFAYTFDELYVRESRHFQGEYRLTMADLMDNRDFWDAIAYGSYDVDIQAASRLDTGYVVYSPMQYGVPFRSLVPLKVDGLLVVGRAASFDSLPHGSARVMPLGMATGEAAAVAAKLAADNGVTFRELSKSKELIKKLREQLTKQGMDLKMNTFETPYYKNHKSYRGLVAAASMLVTSGGDKNESFELDGKSNMQRIVYSMNRVAKQHASYFKGDPSKAIDGISNPGKQPVSVDQAVKTIAHAMNNSEADSLTRDVMIEKGWLTQGTIDSITDQTAITNGEFFMILRDLVEFYVGIVYE
ncbi:FAD-dependent oxidoreductase [Paenibacillus sp. GSMTC-2017]|nr:FAD-dependent oxidoreductase [Paenibacillus sp. GSMTC-2017]